MRVMSLILSFYLTLAIVQIPFIQSLMPEYLQDILAVPEETEYNFLSIVVPADNFDPASAYYNEGLVAMDRQQVETLLASIPGMHQLDLDYYVYETETMTIDVSLYTGDYSSEITEIEFALPSDRLDAISELVDVMLTIGVEIPNSQIFDYNNQKLYKLEEYNLLIRFYSELMATRTLYDDNGRQGTSVFPLY